MPRGNPKKPTIIRLDPALIAEFRAIAGAEANFSAAVAEGIRWWITRERRKAKAGADPLAKHLAPPPPREIAVRNKDGA